MRWWFTLLGASLLGSSGCRSEPQPSAAISAAASPSSPPVMGSADSSANGPLPALGEAEPLIQLPLSGFGPATVAVPVGARTPRPVVVGVHGHSIRPEQACRNWQRVAENYPFVLCPHGLPADAAPGVPVTLGTAAYTAREIDAGLVALRARFGRHVAEAPLTYAGFSLGAKVGVAVVSAEPERYSRVALGEGGYAELDPPVARQWAAAGISKVLLVCSTRPCELSYAALQRRLDGSGLQFRLAAAGGDVHLFDGVVVERARALWPWLVAGAPG